MVESLQQQIARRESELGAFESQLTTQEQLVSEQRGFVSTEEARIKQQEKAFLESTKPRPLTLSRQAGFAKAVGVGRVKESFLKVRKAKKLARKITLPKIAKIKGQITTARGEITTAEQQLATARGQIAPVRTQITFAKGFERGRQLALDGDPSAIFSLQTEAEKLGFTTGLQQEKVFEQQAQLREIGTPIFQMGELKGFEIDSQIIPLERIEIESLQKLEQQGILRLSKVDGKVPITDFGDPTLQTPIPTFAPEKERTKLGKIIRAPFSEKSKELVGLSLGFGLPIPIGDDKFISSGLPDLTFEEAGTFLEEKGGLPGRVTSVFLPKTPGGIAITGGTMAVFPFLPKIGRQVGTLLFGVAGTRTALDTSLTIEERIAGGIVGGLGFAGAGFEAVPFIRGARAKFSPDFFKVAKQPKGFEAIELIQKTKVKPEPYAELLAKEGLIEFKPSTKLGKDVSGEITFDSSGRQKPVIKIAKGLKGKGREETIAHELIHFKTPELLRESPLEILPYDLRPSEVIAFTLQKPLARKGFSVFEDIKIGLIEAGSPAKTGVTGSVKLPKTSPLKRGGFGVKQGEKTLFLGEQDLATSQIGFFKTGKDIPLQREFFVTPAEPFLKIPETRISRLGLDNLFKFPKDFEIGFGLPKQPQIGILRKGKVGVKETADQFAIGKGSELEAIKSEGIIKDVTKIGQTTIRSQAVDIFEFKIGGLDKAVRTPKVLNVKTSTTSFIPPTRISGETLLGSLGISQLTRGLSFPAFGVGRSSPPSRKPSRGVTPPFLDFQTDIISPGISPPISPVIRPPSSPPSPPTIIRIPGLTFGRGKPPKRPRRRKSDDGKRKVKKLIKRKRRQGRIAPSFTSIVAELKGGLPKEFRNLGILPSQLRRL